MAALLHDECDLEIRGGLQQGLGVVLIDGNLDPCVDVLEDGLHGSVVQHDVVRPQNDLTFVPFCE